MESFLKKIAEGRKDHEAKRYFLRFGRGDYKRRFLLSYNKTTKIKIKGSFELANEFVKFVRENKEVKYSGSVLSKVSVPGIQGRKKGGVFAYEVSESTLEEFENPYYYLVNANSDDIVLKIKKSLPKPGKDEEKIDDSFCTLEIGEKYWHKAKETFFWDVPDGKKAVVEHEIIINDVELPKDTSPESIRENAVRKGKIIRKISIDGKVLEKEYKLEI